MSPTRPRQHEIDEECRRAFQNFIPSAWIVRPVEDDYGIDREVEIFIGRRATGMIFKVQLKGGDNSDARPRRRVKCDSLAYWKSLPVPVLIVHHCASTSSLHGRWAHSVPPPSRPDQQTMTVHFHEEHLLLANSERLISDVTIEREASAGRWPRPAPVSVTTSEAGAPNQAHLRTFLRVFVAHERLGSLVAIDSTSEYSLRVVCDWDEIHVRAPVDIASWKTACAAGQAPPDSRMHILAWEILLCCSMVMLCCKNFESGLALYEKVAGNTGQARSWPVLSLVIHFLMREQRIEDAIRVIGPLISNQDPELRQDAQLLALAVIPHLRHVRAELLDDFLHHLRQSAELDETEFPDSAGTTHYNIANILQTQGRWEEVSHHLQEALRLFPDYGKRAYFFRDRAASNYETQHYAQSARDYSRAMELGHDKSEVTPLLADALMGAGRYRDAHRLLLEHEYTGGPLDPFAHLTTMSLATILRISGLEVQERQLTDAGAPHDGAWTSGLALRRIVEHDALDHEPWMHLEAADEVDLAAHLLVIAQLLQNYGPAWAQVALAYWSLGDLKTMGYATQHAYRHCGAEFLDAATFFAEVAGCQGERFLNLLHLIGESREAPPRPFMYRYDGEPLSEQDGS